MIRSLAVLVFIFTVLPVLHARRVEGRVHSGSRLLSGVIVTDGEKFALTGADGTFRFESGEQSEYISIVVPSGYTESSDSFFQLKENRRWFDFDLSPSYRSAVYSLMAFDIPPSGSSQPDGGVFEEEILPDLESASIRARIKGRTIGFVFGAPSEKAFEALKGTKIPLYGVGRTGSMPGDYAFFVENDLIIVSDRAEYVSKLLKYIPSDTRIFLMLSAPSYSLPDGGAGFLSILEGRKVDIISGYDARRHNTVFSESIFEHVLPSLGGEYWGAERNSDGSPRGFAIFRRQGEDLSWEIKNVGFDDDYQMEIFAPGSHRSHPNELLVKAWDYDPSWTVTWTQDGSAPAPMTQVEPSLLAANPSRYAGEAVISVTDRFGRSRTFTENLSANIEKTIGFSFREKTSEQLYEEVFSAIDDGFGNLFFNLQLTRGGKVILCRDSYPRFSDEPGGVEVRELVERIEAYAESRNLSARRYVFSINSGSGAGEGKVWPQYEYFAETCLGAIDAGKLGERLIVASFDDRLLNYLHSSHPKLALMYLVDAESGDYSEAMSLLDFIPRWIGIQYEILSDGWVSAARRDAVKVSVWDITSDEFAARSREIGADAYIKD